MQEENTAETSESTATPSADASKDVQTETEVKTEKVKTEETTSPEKSEADAEKTATEPKPKVSKSQKRIASQAYKLREQDRRIDRLIDVVEKQQPQAKAPKIEDFETIDEYLNARDSHRDSRKDSPKDQTEEMEERTQEAVEDLRATGSEKYEDFDEVVFDESVKTTPIMRDAVLSVEDPEMQADVAYFLGQNTKETARISRLPPIRQAMEIGKLEAKLLKSAPKRPSAAPKPITPVGGAKTPTDAHNPDDDYVTFRKKREKELGRG